MTSISVNRTVSIAPMMDRTDRHFRYLLRLLSPNVLLYTEMVVAQAITHGNGERFLGHHAVEQPLVLQLGGSEAAALAEAAVVGEQYGYAAINLNIGCPSDRVQSGQFGACLMAHPERVADCVQAIRERVGVPVSIKTRIGIDDREDYAFLREFVEQTHSAGCTEFIVHARKALLEGLSPAENCTIPPLKYATVYRLKEDFPELHISLNGGVRATDEVRHHLAAVDGVMIGRQAYKEPYWIAELERDVLADHDWCPPPREQVVLQMADYAECALSHGARLPHITRHMLGLYAGVPGARSWRRYLSEATRKPTAGPQVLVDSLQFVAAC